jgi:hypothetical protein
MRAWLSHFLINAAGAAQSLWYALIPPHWTGHDSATLNDLAHMTPARAIRVGLVVSPDEAPLHNALGALYADHLGLPEPSFAQSMVVAAWLRYCREVDRHPMYRDRPWDAGSIPSEMAWALKTGLGARLNG